MKTKKACKIPSDVMEINNKADGIQQLDKL